MKWFLAGLVTLLVLGPGVLSLTRGRDQGRRRPWLGTGAAIAIAALWVLAVVALLRAL